MNNEIIQGNKLIAEFMGGTLDSPSAPYYYFLSEGRYKTELLYHSSWDWLIPVIEKIYELDLQRGLVFTIKDCLASACLYDTYNCVVEFIENYNCNKNE
jgi:hypothetical protein